MKRSLVVTLSGLVVLVPLLLNAATFAQLKGKWRAPTEEGVALLEFRSASRLVYDDEELGYALVKGAIRVEGDFGPVDYPYTLVQGALSITFPEGYTLKFKRVTAASAGKSGGTKTALAQHFAGTWKNYTKNTETMVVLGTDGAFFERYTGSYSGGEYGSDWGAASETQGRGRWSAQGNKSSGVITITYADGSSNRVEYRVHVENGQTYWSEYYFNGDLYGKVNE